MLQNTDIHTDGLLNMLLPQYIRFSINSKNQLLKKWENSHRDTAKNILTQRTKKPRISFVAIKKIVGIGLLPSSAVKITACGIWPGNS